MPERGKSGFATVSSTYIRPVEVIGKPSLFSRRLKCSEIRKQDVMCPTPRSRFGLDVGFVVQCGRYCRRQSGLKFIFLNHLKSLQTRVA